MFDRIRKAFSKSEPTRREPVVGRPDPNDPVSQWAQTQGLGYTVQGGGQGFSLRGKVGNKPWRMERGRSTRNYIQGEELRARAELDLGDGIAIMVMNRPLKESLEKSAYSMITDSLQTTADPNLPAEMRWLAMYDEVGWESLPREFWRRYSVITPDREQALAWIDPALAALLLEWPEPAPAATVPFVLMIQQSRAYLRMQYAPAGMPTLQHASAIFSSACESALEGFGQRD